jgi:ABC-2 type transport system ATP-binding protein
MKRRLGFAAALLGEPQVLLLDEPTAGVDPQSRAALLDLVEEERSRGAAVLYSTHLMEEVQTLADLVVVLSQGRVLASGTVADLLDRYAQPQLEIEVEDKDSVSAALRAALVHADCFEVVDSTAGETETAGGRTRVRLRTTDRARALPTAVHAAEQVGAVVTDVRLIEPSLESVFLTLTGRGLSDR